MRRAPVRRRDDGEAERGFDPIADEDAPSLFGTVVYAGRTEPLRARGVKVVTGEALTLCGVVDRTPPPSPPPSRGRVARTRDVGGPPPLPAPKHFYVVVRNADGESGEVALAALSSRPLHYDLRRPGTAGALLAAAYREARTLARKIDALHARYGFALSTTDPDAARQRDLDLARAMSESFAAHKVLVSYLVSGSSMAKESLLREKMWAVRFGDPALVDVYSKGIADPAERKDKRRFTTCLGNLAGAVQSGNAIRRAEEEKHEKPWRWKMQGVPEAQLAALDAENLRKLDAEIERMKAQREEQLASPSCEQPSG